LRAVVQSREESRPPAVVGHFVFGMRELLPLIDQAATALDALSCRERFAGE
jgi:hypothetical protein